MGNWGTKTNPETSPVLGQLPFSSPRRLIPPGVKAPGLSLLWQSKCIAVMQGLRGDGGVPRSRFLARSKCYVSPL